MQKLLSITIPAYNSEKYINKCLDSLIDKDIMSFFEVIVVNDGSQDGTRDIVEQYTAKYPQTFRLINKENGGHGSVVNRGIQEARGKYFCVLDSDDWYDTKALKTLVQHLANTDIDIVLTNYQKVYKDTNETKKYTYDLSIYGNVLDIDYLLNNNIAVAMANIVYKLSILKNVNLRLQEKTYYVDEEYAVIPFSRIKSITALNIILYNYLIGHQEQSMSIINQINNLSDKKKVALNLINFYNQTNMSASNRMYVLKKIQNLIVFVFPIAMIYNSNKRQGRKFSKQFVKEIKHLNKEIFIKLRMKYYAYKLMSLIGLSTQQYEHIQARRGN